MLQKPSQSCVIGEKLEPVQEAVVCTPNSEQKETIQEEKSTTAKETSSNNTCHDNDHDAPSTSGEMTDQGGICDDGNSDNLVSSCDGEYFF